MPTPIYMKQTPVYDRAVGFVRPHVFLHNGVWWQMTRICGRPWFKRIEDWR